MIRLRSLGESVIEIEETRIGPQQEVLFALLVTLVLERGRRIGRQEITTLLWSDSQTAQARHCLRQALYRIRSLGVSIKHLKDGLQLDSGDAICDLDEWLTSTYEVRIKSENVGLGFLPAYYPFTTYAFTEFIDRHRGSANARICRQLVRDLDLARSSRDWPTVDLIARRVLQLDPLHEEGTLALAEATAWHGSKHQAIELLNAYVAELGSTGHALTLPATALRRRISDYHSRQSRSQTDGEAPLVGRSAEHRILSDAIARARAGVSQTIWVTGPMGIGKTRLAQEALKYAVLCGVQSAQIAARPTDARHPLATFAHLISALTDLRGALGCSPESLACLQTLAGRGAALDEPLAFHGAETQLPAIRRAFFDLLDALAAEAPLVVLVDDVQWLDPFSTILLADATDSTATRRLLLLITSRHGHGDQDVRFRESPSLLHLPLAPLEERDSRTVLVDAMGPAHTSAGDEHLCWCIDIAQGNPLHLKALGAHWADTREQFVLPPSLSTILVARVSLLSEVAQLVLQASALLGRHCTHERLERILDLPSHQLCLALNEIERAGMLSSARPLQPRHELIAEAALAKLAGASRTVLHRKIALVLEKDLEASRFSPLLWDIAHHWHAAGDSSRVLTTAQRCAAHLARVGLPGEAAEVLADIEDFCSSLSEKHQLVLARTRALHLAGRYPESLIQSEKARDLGARLQDGQPYHSDVEFIALEAGWRQDEPIQLLLAQARRCVIDASASREHRLEAARWGLIFADNMGAIDSATEIYQRALPIAASDLQSGSAWSTIELIYHASFGDLSRALAAADTLIAARRKQGSYFELSRALRHASAVFFAGDREAEGEASLLEALEIGRRYRLAGNVHASAQRLACRFLQVGALEQAREWANVAGEWLHPTFGDKTATEDLLAIRARIALAEGQPVEARALANPTLQAILSDPVETRRQTKLVYYVRLRLGLHAPIGELAIRSLEEIVRRRLTKIGQDGPVFSLCFALARQDAWSAVEPLLADYIRTFRRDRRPLPVPLQALHSMNHDPQLLERHERSLLGMEH